MPSFSHKEELKIWAKVEVVISPMKNNRHGKAAIISDADFSKIRKCIRSKKYKLLLDIARYTGERWGAICQLSLSDVYCPAGQPKAEITFRARTRKANTKGKRETRSVPVHPTLKELLEAYTPDTDSVWLFPSRLDGSRPCTLRSMDGMLRAALNKAGLSHKGYSTHSTRRTFITRLHESGVDIHTIQAITGHADIKTLTGYIENNPQRIARAIALL